jgi:hypothetical protein
MGIENFIEEAAGAFAADKALEAVDPNAGILAKGAAVIAGFEGVSKVKDYLNSGSEQAEAPPADDAPQS